MHNLRTKRPDIFIKSRQNYVLFLFLTVWHDLRKFSMSILLMNCLFCNMSLVSVDGVFLPRKKQNTGESNRRFKHNRGVKKIHNDKSTKKNNIIRSQVDQRWQKELQVQALALLSLLKPNYWCCNCSDQYSSMSCPLSWGWEKSSRC